MPCVCLFKQKGGFTLHKKGQGTRSVSIDLAMKSRDTREGAAVRKGQFASMAFFWWCQSLPVAERSQRSPERDAWLCPSVQDEVSASCSSLCPPAPMWNPEHGQAGSVLPSTAGTQRPYTEPFFRKSCSGLTPALIKTPIPTAVLLLLLFTQHLGLMS